MLKRIAIVAAPFLFASTAFAAPLIPTVNPNPLAQSLKDAKVNPAADEADRGSIPGVALPGVNTGANTMIGMNANVGAGVSGAVQLRINF